ncbi:MAG: hypothetical protein JST28_16840 [Acidobacteria bacterium]|nr:hypothetical protein [Acidobacteriota bacterium]
MRIGHCSQVASRFVLLPSLLAAFFLLGSPQSAAQDSEIITIELARGYITATNLPDSFDVDDQHIILQRLTGFRLKGAKPETSDESLRSRLQTGAYVSVLGKTSHKKRIADVVVFRPDWNEEISGLGPVNSVVEAGAERVFRADGFTIRVPSSAETSFRGEVHSLDDVGAGTWLHYKGKLDSHGVLIAASADFMSMKPGKPVEVVNGKDDYKISFFPPDFAGHVDGRVKPGRMTSWHVVPADRALYDRLQRIGSRLIPPFQRELADDDPRKIRLQIYAVDGNDMRSFMCAPRGGLIFFPKHLIDRMQRDDQLAAALAMPIAFLLQRQGIGKEMREWPAVRDQLTTAAFYAAIPFSGALALDMMGALPDHNIAVRAQQQVGRIAISLTADAGYDPWQAPEAFRLLAAKRSEKGAIVVKWTDLSEYALGILNLQYRGQAAAESVEASRAAAH